MSRKGWFKQGRGVGANFRAVELPSQMYRFFHWQYSGALIGIFWTGWLSMIALATTVSGISTVAFWSAYVFIALAIIWATGFFITVSRPPKETGSGAVPPLLYDSDGKGISLPGSGAGTVSRSKGLAILGVGVFGMGCVWATWHLQVMTELSRADGTLTPANDPPPFRHTCKLSPEDSVFIYFGTAAASYAPPNFQHHAVIRLSGHDVLSLDTGPNGEISISTQIFDQDGLLLEMVAGKFKVFRGDFVKYERRDQHTLVVFDKWGKERIRVRYLNQKAISVTGVFFYPGSASVVADGHSLSIGGMVISGGSCIGGSGAADIATN